MPKLSDHLQQEAALLLYNRLISPGGPAAVADLAEALGIGQSTVYRQCSGDIPVQLRTIAALAELDLEGFKALLDLIGRQLGVAWQWRVALPEAPAIFEALQAVTEVSLACSEAAFLEVTALQDGKIHRAELALLEQKWATEDYKRERMRAQIRALAANEP